MTAFAGVEARIRELGKAEDVRAAAAELLAQGERILEIWIAEARGETPGEEEREGFRLLALHRQGAKGDPSFNACRESCRELVYRYNMIAMEPAHEDVRQRLKLMSMVALHLCLFIGGKLQEMELGEFCCSSRPIRAGAEAH